MYLYVTPTMTACDQLFYSDMAMSSAVFPCGTNALVSDFFYTT